MSLLAGTTHACQTKRKNGKIAAIKHSSVLPLSNWQKAPLRTFTCKVVVERERGTQREGRRGAKEGK